MVRQSTLLLISTVAVSTSAIFAIVFFVQSAQTQASLEAINQALLNNDIPKALSIALNPQAIIDIDNNSTESDREEMEPSFFERLYGNP